MKSLTKQSEAFEGATKTDRRKGERKNLTSIKVAELTSISNYGLIASEACIVDVSLQGFLLQLDRKLITQEDLRADLNLDAIKGETLLMVLPDMNLDLDGEVTRTKHLGKGLFEVAIEFSEDVPEYWRQCLIDLLPGPNEI